MQEKNNDFFTFSEILTGFKDELVQNRDTLQRLKAFTEVKTTDNIAIEYFLQENGAIIDDYVIEDYPHLELYVRKLPTTLPVLYRSIRYRNSDPNLLVDRANYNVIKEDNGFIFEVIDNLNFGDKIYHPEVTVLDYGEFLKLYNKITNSKLFNLPTIYKNINPYQLLIVDSNRIELQNESGETRKYISICFDPKTNKVLLNQRGRHSSMFISDLLQTQIPKSVLPQEYINILDQSEDKIDELYFDSVSHNGKEYYTIDDDVLRLTKKR